MQVQWGRGGWRHSRPPHFHPGCRSIFCKIPTGLRNGTECRFLTLRETGEAWGRFPAWCVAFARTASSMKLSLKSIVSHIPHKGPFCFHELSLVRRRVPKMPGGSWAVRQGDEFLWE